MWKNWNDMTEEKGVYIYANLLGNGSGRIIYDGSCRIAEGGEMLATGPRLIHADVALVDQPRQHAQRPHSPPWLHPEKPTD